MRLLIAGLFSRVAAFGAASVMTVAVLTAHAANGFFMNWYGNEKGKGFHLLAFGLSLIVLVHAGGNAAIDPVIQSKWSASDAQS